jgi:hypothetical protein
VANAGTFKKGEKRPKQGKHGSPRAVLAARQMVSSIAEGNAHRVQGWLDEIYVQDGPRVALECYTKLLEYAVPKLARTVVASECEPATLTVRWLSATD